MSHPEYPHKQKYSHKQKYPLTRGGVPILVRTLQDLNFQKIRHPYSKLKTHAHTIKNIMKFYVHVAKVDEERGNL